MIAAKAAALVIAAVFPFAITSDVLAAGLFSLVNTALNVAALIYMQRTRHELKPVNDKLNAVKEVTDTVALRETDRTPHRDMEKE